MTISLRSNLPVVPESPGSPPIVTVSEFKLRCLALLKRLGPEGVVLTRRGEPVAQVIPYPSSPAALIGCMRGKLTIRGDILSTGISWESDDQS